MLLSKSSNIYDQKHRHVLLILMGKIRIGGQEFTLTNAARCRLRTVLGSRVYAPLVLLKSFYRAGTHQSLSSVESPNFQCQCFLRNTVNICAFSSHSISWPIVQCYFVSALHINSGFHSFL